MLNPESYVKLSILSSNIFIPLRFNFTRERVINSSAFLSCYFYLLSSQMKYRKSVRILCINLDREKTVISQKLE
ncbi:hypothetical protein GCM10023262_10590 [Bartonella pachyuromydis]|uniref:Uncharacterized protein n=1 Tax=Bartonella pachyuromydis TaxID=931097 RepID=A0ABP8VIX1_9HYPH